MVSEAQPSLQKMGDGLVARYTKAGQPPPELLYTDRDCCCESGPSKYHALFAAWDHLCVRLDIWHYMRRLAAGCTSESHPLYGTFMARLSGCIFAWDGEDVQLLMSAKGNELMNAGIPHPSESAIRKAVTKEELARHCCRRTQRRQLP